MATSIVFPPNRFAVCRLFATFACMTHSEYIAELNRQMATGMAREHSYRPALKQLLDATLPGFDVTNEPRRIACGAPDFIIMRHADGLPAAFVETKDIGDTDLDGRRQHREQFARYRDSLDHIVFTDYLDFHFYEGGQLTDAIRLGELRGDKAVACKDGFPLWQAAMQRMAGAEPQAITSATRLAEAMAAKARLLGDIMRKSIDEEDPNEHPDAEMSQIATEYMAFKDVLISTLTYEEFADIYSQTIVYGMFAARLHDTTPDTFSRFEAATLIPKTNPFLRKVFQNIAGYDLDERIAWVVDDVATMFRATELNRIMADYGGHDSRRDPMIHFYEDFLRAYHPALRKEKGVWYTPLPVVRFMVGAVDGLLASDFNLPMGLADYSLVAREVANSQYNPKRRGEHKTYKIMFHKVQILDPATGTGTFLAEAVNLIHDKFLGQQGLWQDYVAEHLLPRLNGFELLMAPYTIAHLKLDMVLRATGYEHRSDERLRIFLTNSLEEPHQNTGTIFAKWLSDEANAANRIKRDTPVMVLLGNPPYNGESRNKGEWIMELMETYKKEPGGKARLAERNPKWINDDYVKFIRMAQHFIEKNGEGVLAYINPHGFLDNPTFRGMRWNLLRTFDKIYAIDLHGNSKKKETAPDGGKDENVFNIQQGVSINIFVKTGHKKATDLGRVYHYDIFGRRQAKLNFLANHSLADIPFTEVTPREPMFFLVPKDFGAEEEYNRGFAVNELFVESSVGIVTTKDSFLICDTEEEVERRITDLIKLSPEEIRDKYHLNDTRDWTIAKAKADVGPTFDRNKILPINYRPFDTKFLYYTGLTNGIVARPRYHSMRHLLIPANLALLTCRQSATNGWSLVSITKSPFDVGNISAKGEKGYNDDCRVSNRTKERGYMFPLYIYNKNTGEAGRFFEDSQKAPNFRPDIIAKIEEALGEEAEPIELFDYIYAVLHSPAYRERYKEFLKIDFPRIPYPADRQLFHALAEKGTELRQLHLMEGSAGWSVGATFPYAGSNVVEQLRHDGERVWINDGQCFGGVSPEAWNFFIGGYQPAQKWLKDRRGQRLDFAAIRHYEEIIYALCATRRLMQEIDALPLPWAAS